MCWNGSSIRITRAAHRIMMHVHQHGIGECGVYTYEVAETKVTQVMDFCPQTSASPAVRHGKKVTMMEKREHRDYITR